MGHEMSKTDDPRSTREFKLEAIRLVKAGQEMSVTARVLNIPKATLGSWVRLGKDRVWLLIKLHGIKARSKRKLVVTTAGTACRRRRTCWPGTSARAHEN